MCSRLATCLTAIAALASSAGWADSAWSVRSWQVNDGSNGAVVGIAQSDDGYLWVATVSGLSQFDGAQFKFYSAGKELGLAKSNVRMIERSRGGDLWAAVEGAIVRLSAVRPASIIQERIPQSRPDCIVEDATGSMWFAYHSGPVLRITGDQVTVLDAEAGIPGGSNGSLAIDNQGQVWFARGSSIGIIRDGAFQAVAQHSAPLSLAPARDGGIWVASGTTIFKYDQEHGFKTLAKVPLNHPNSSVPMKLFEDHRGILWVGTDTGGLFQLSGSRCENIPTPQSKITCFAEDREDNLWVGTDAGFDRISPCAVEMEDKETGLPLCSAISVCQAPDGQIWAAMADGSLMVRNGSRWAAPPFKFTSTATCLVADNNGGIWIGTRSQRILHWKGGKLTTWDASKGLGFRLVVTLLAASNGDLWVGSNADKVQRLRGDKFVDFKLPSNSGRSAAMAEDQNGDIWIGRAGSGGLVRIHGDEVSDETALADHKPVQALCVTPDGSLWLALRAIGLGRYKNGQMRRISLNQGFLDDNVEQIVTDGRGWLWFGSNHGIFRVREQELNDLADGKIDRVQSVSHGGDEGLPPLQARMDVSPSATRANDGRIWMPMASGLAIVNPENIPDRAVPPRAYIQQATIDDRVVFMSSDYFAKRSKDPGDDQATPLQLKPDYGRLELHFTSPTFRSPENVRFRYRLEGFSRDWNEKTGPRVQIIPRLPAGSYCFRVQAANAEGIWGDETAAVSFVVAPFFWQRWWFQVGVGVLALAALLLIARYAWFRRLRRQLQILEQRTALDRERARIARDLHDDLGHALTQIVLLSDLTRHDSQDPDELESHLQHIASTARLGIKSLDETVWAINPRNDTLADLVDYLGQFAMESLRAANIRCQLDLPDRPPSLAVPTEVRHSLFLAVKEAVNNVLRHAEATAVALGIALADNEMTIAIADNGRGFAAAPGQPGQDGLHNISQRMRDIGGSAQIESTPGSGTRVLLKLTLADAKPASVSVETREHDADLCLHR